MIGDLHLSKTSLVTTLLELTCTLRHHGSLGLGPAAPVACILIQSALDGDPHLHLLAWHQRLQRDVHFDLPESHRLAVDVLSCNNVLVFTKRVLLDVPLWPSSPGPLRCNGSCTSCVGSIWGQWIARTPAAVPQGRFAAETPGWEAPGELGVQKDVMIWKIQHRFNFFIIRFPMREKPHSDPPQRRSVCRGYCCLPRHPGGFPRTNEYP